MLLEVFRSRSSHPVLSTALLAVTLVLGCETRESPGTPLPIPTTAEVLAESSAADWRPLDPEHTVYLDLPAGRVVFELAPWFAPEHVKNIESLVRGRYFDGLVILRSQDNYVVQWGDPASGTDDARPLDAPTDGMSPQFDRSWDAALPWTPLGDDDAYAPEAGFVHELPAGRDVAAGRLWLAHCYGMVGVGRDVPPDPGNGAELYVFIGHAPRHLDRNVMLVGRVVQGIELLSTLPRGSGSLGFYEDSVEQVPLLSVRLAAELPSDERVPLEILRSDTPTFEALIASRRTRRESWFVEPVGKLEICNVPLPVRRAN